MEKLLSASNQCYDHIEKKVHETIIVLHQFFEGWLGGVLENTFVNEQYLEAQFSSDFAMVLPQGMLQNHHDAVESLKKAWGAVPGLKIRIYDVRIVFEDATSVMAVYKEDQLIQNFENRRISSVLFQKDGDILKWRFVQET
ncbi:MAG TPA: hypothetical protein VD794_11505, partial [Flavisolibacter sp.]|nr:hypothetical protein [Flavisolibacter sp.]